MLHFLASLRFALPPAPPPRSPSPSPSGPPLLYVSRQRGVERLLRERVVHIHQALPILRLHSQTQGPVCPPSPIHPRPVHTNSVQTHIPSIPHQTPTKLAALPPQPRSTKPYQTTPTSPPPPHRALLPTARPLDSVSSPYSLTATQLADRNLKSPRLFHCQSTPTEPLAVFLPFRLYDEASAAVASPPQRPPAPSSSGINICRSFERNKKRQKQTHSTVYGALCYMRNAKHEPSSRQERFVLCASA